MFINNKINSRVKELSIKVQIIRKSLFVLLKLYLKNSKFKHLYFWWALSLKDFKVDIEIKHFKPGQNLSSNFWQ